MKPTEEQSTCVDLALKGGNLAISALAGSGKTSTLLLIAEAMTTKHIAYLAFNRAIADYAATKFPANVECVTVHSLAYRAVGWQYKSRLSGKLKPIDVKRALSLSEEGDHRTALLVMRTMQRYIKSADITISNNHVDSQLLGIILGHTDDQERIVKSQNYVISNAVRLFNLLADPACKLPIDHDFYLKLWQMQQPTLPYEVVFLDECQDADAVMLNIIGNQSASQVIIVGDQKQNLYAWRSTVDAFKCFPVANTAMLTQSFRFGDAIAAVANKVLNGSAVIKGNPATDSSVYHTGNYSELSLPDCVICRTNFGVISSTLEFMDSGLQVYVEGGTAAITMLLSGIIDLMTKGKSSHPELSMFNSWGELTDYAESEEGSEYASIVLLVKRYTGRLPYLISRLKSCVSDPAQAHVTVTTCHKAKGKEWHHVRLFNDFKPLEVKDGKVINQAEQCVLYVAVTRAIRQLDVRDVIAVDSLY